MQKLFTLVLIVLFSVMAPLTAAAANCTPQITITKLGSADTVKKSAPVVKVINKTNAPAEYHKLIAYYGKTTSKYYTPVTKKPTGKIPVVKKPVVKISVVKKPTVVVKPPVVKPPVVTPPVVEPPVVTPPVVKPPVVEPPSSEFNAMQLEMLSYINAARSEAGMPALTLNKALCEGAYLKSKDMAVNSYFSHTSPTYGSPFDMMNSLGITYRAAGENIAKNISVKGAHDAFMNSSGHSANILSGNFGKVGLGFYQQGNYLYVTQWFTN
jgi:uncharacterized protein YkwD